MKIAIYSRKSKFIGKGESVENRIVLCCDYIQRNIPEVTDSVIFVYEVGALYKVTSIFFRRAWQQHPV